MLTIDNAMHEETRDSERSEDSYWGFIGSDYALEEATSAFDYAVQAADRELAESTYWAARDVATV